MENARRAIRIVEGRAHPPAPGEFFCSMIIQFFHLYEVGQLPGTSVQFFHLYEVGQLPGTSVQFFHLYEVEVAD
jgi:hypothetical protein